MSKAINALALFLVFACTPLFAQSDDEGEGVVSASPRNNDDARYEELSAKVDKLQDKLNSLAITAGRYASENQRLKDENSRLQSELFSINSEVDQARDLADDASKRFDSSVVNVDQRDQMRLDYDRRVADFCADAWGTEDDRDQCSRQFNNFETVDSIMKSR